MGAWPTPDKRHAGQQREGVSCHARAWKARHRCGVRKQRMQLGGRLWVAWGIINLGKKNGIGSRLQRGLTAYGCGNGGSSGRGAIMVYSRQKGREK